MVESASSNDNIKVVIRFRPQNKIEASNKGTPCVQFWKDSAFTISSTEGNTRPPVKHEFTFDKVFDPSSTQREVFDYVALPVVKNVLEGFNATIFAYGQTGCGKTHTMAGDINSESLKGLIPRTIEALFDAIYASPEHIEYTIQCSYVEIYMEMIRDLLDPKSNNLAIRQNNSKIFLEPLKEIYVTNPKETLEVMAKGDLYRTTASTKMNETSSRSHSIFIINFKKNDTKTATETSSTLYLVDLAGSEKVAKTGATGQTLEEAKKINSSLSSLGNVINALTDQKSTHIPYRDSKLTRLLQDSLGGNAKTTLICCASVSSFNDAETLSTIRFGMRAKSIKNEARVNKQRTLGEVEKLLSISEAENQRLRLLIKNLGANPDEDIPGVEQLEPIEEKYHEDDGEKELLLEQIEVLQQKINEKEEMSVFFEEQINSLLASISEIENERDSIKTQLENTQQISEKIEQNSEDSKKVEILESELQKYTKNLSEKSVLVENLQKKITSLEEEKTELTQRIEALEAEIEKIAELQEKNKNLESLLENQKKIVENRRNLSNSREMSLIESQKNFKTLLENSEKMIQNYEIELEKSAKLAVEEHESFSLTSLELQKKISNLTILNSKFEEEIAALKQSYDDILENNSSKNLVKKIKFLTENIQELRSKYYQSYSRINDYRITIEFKNRQISSKNNFIMKLSEEVKNIEEKSAQKIRDLENKIENIQNLEDKIENPTFTKKIILTGKHETTIKTIRGNASPSFLTSPTTDAALTRKLNNMPLSPTIDLEKRDDDIQVSPEPFAPPSLLCESPVANK